MKAFKQILRNAIYFRLSKYNEEEDIFKFLRAMLAEGNDAVMGFVDQGVNEDRDHSIKAYRMRKKGNKSELVKMIMTKFSDCGTIFHLW